MRAVNDTVENRFSEGWIANILVPAADGNLAGNVANDAKPH